MDSVPKSRQKGVLRWKSSHLCLGWKNSVTVRPFSTKISVRVKCRGQLEN